MCALLSGCQNFQGIFEFGQHLLFDARKRLGFRPFNMPTEPVIRNLLNNIEPYEFDRVVREWLGKNVLEDKHPCGAFLPLMWEQLPAKNEFWHHLKRKAGLPSNYWSKTVRVSRFQADYYLESGNKDSSSSRSE